MHRVTTLTSGLRVITSKMPHMESVAVGLWVGVGARHENEKLNGISHFLEHLLFKGTAKRSAAQISREIESVGGSLNGFTGEEYTCYLAKVLPKKMKLACEVLSDMYLNPALRQEDIEREKDVVKEEINMYRDTPQHHVTDLFNRALWGEHPLGRPLVGTPETVSSFSRGTLRRYMRQGYAPRNTVVAAAGKLRHERMVEIAGELIGPRRRIPGPPYVPARRRRGGTSLVLERRSTEQTHLCVGVRAYRRNHPRRFALQLLSVIMGENMSSRLFQNVREKRGLAYAIHSSVVRFRDAGAFLVSAGVENGKFLRALRVILTELARVKNSGVRKSELARAKEYYCGQLAMSLEKTMPSMLRIGENLLCTGRVLTKDEIFSRLMSVGVDDVGSVAADILSGEGVSLAAIGPLGESDETIGECLHF